MPLAIELSLKATNMQNQAFENEVLRLTNEFRKKNGLKALVLDTNLDKTADKHSKDMAMQDYFSHDGKDGSKPWDRARREGYETGTVGENIAAGYSSAKAVVDGWIASPGHRANMLRANYNEIGIGHYYLANDTGKVNYRHYWTQVFGQGTIESPAPSAEPPAPTPEPTPTPTPPQAPNPTMSNNAVIRGTDRADKLIGSAKSQSIFGKKGNDLLEGKGGNDKLYGNEGKDVIRGDDGNDQIWGGSGDDRIGGGAGNDIIEGNSGNDKIWGSSGKDIIRGDDGNDQLWGGSGDDRIGGGAGNDVIRGDDGNDKIWGSFGNDRIGGGAGNDVIRGGSGNDKIWGSFGNDRLLGETGSDKLVGGDGNDVLQGSGGKTAPEKDVMTGGNGRDKFILGNQSGTFYDDGKAGSMGTSNYALITDLNVSQGDMIQLSNDHNYRLGSAPNGVESGRALFIDNPSGQKDELIAVIQGSGNLNLNSSTFKYV